MKVITLFDIFIRLSLVKHILPSIKIVHILLIIGLLFSACSKEKKLTITDVSFSSSKDYSLDQQSIKRKLLGIKVGFAKFDNQLKVNFYNSKDIIEESFVLDKVDFKTYDYHYTSEQQYKGSLLTYNYLPTIPIQFAQVMGNLLDQYIQFEIMLTINKNKIGCISSIKMEIYNKQGRMFLTLK